MKNIFIFGATSAIAEELAKRYAVDGHNLTLFGRSQEKLELIQQDLTVRGASQVNCVSFDVADEQYLASVEQAISGQDGNLDVCIIAHGSLPNQSACEKEVSMTLQELRTNGSSVIAILTLVANRMEQQKSGEIAVISSVAGVRGRQSNYVYGAAKGMVSVFLQGLGQRLAKSGVHVLDIKPGFVDTPMTAEFKKGALWAKPEAIAEIIYKRLAKKSHFSYAPLFWFFIMTIISFIPTRIFKKLKL